MTNLFTLATNDYPLGRGSYNSAVKLYKLVQKLIKENNFFILEKIYKQPPEKNPNYDYKLTDTARVAYTLLCDQFYIANIEKDGRFLRRSFREVKNDLEMIGHFL